MTEYMKNKGIISFVLIFSVAFAACQKEIQTQVKFGSDKENITVGAEGGTETVHISAGEGWVANSTSPWISISPANGSGSGGHYSACKRYPRGHSPLYVKVRGRLDCGHPRDTDWVREDDCSQQD